MSFVALTCLLIAIDGDTLRCGKERIRLLGIDAPEMPGHCRRGRKCVEGDPYASKASLASMIEGSAQIERRGRDRYGRTLGKVRVNGVDLSKAQVSFGMATAVKRWE
ncbi:thermonuclease family protein [uncultured Sphingomonas sp.]|uniref:thermonuclease family protein n=1 Tax=uncultured Sphingomonas sp. TaxID=158754 RepID=UPI0025D2057A|nr:thermonuclease family protein [uncultured Sphingomonas sp.]